MRITVSVTAAILAVVAAAPAHDPATELLCPRPGMPCLKRSTDELNQASKRWCMRPGMPCWKVKRATDALSAAMTDDSDIEARSTMFDYPYGPGSAAFYAYSAMDELANLAALSTPDAQAYYNSLNLPKDTSITAEDDAGALKRRWCMRPGMPCWKRSTDDEGHDAAEEKRWCMRPGMPCWKVKRAAESILEATEDAEDDAGGPETDEDDDGFFRCWGRGSLCYQTKRDMYAMRAIARTVADAF